MHHALRPPPEGDSWPMRCRLVGVPSLGVGSATLYAVYDVVGCWTVMNLVSLAACAAGVERALFTSAILPCQGLSAFIASRCPSVQVSAACGPGTCRWRLTLLLLASRVWT
jgi:hypothetical protein